MARDRTDSGTPTAELPEQRGQVRSLRDGEYAKTLIPKLVPVVDRIRQLSTNFGLMPYRVFLVHLSWGGMRVGEGQPYEIGRVEILPTPEVGDLNATSEVLRPLGLSEEGSLSISQISAKYTEDDLMGRTPDLTNPALPSTTSRNTEFFYEVVESRPSSPRSTRRRYVPSSVPALSRDGFQWRVTLTKQDYNRVREGSLGLV
jgi:hypothetical protein